MPVDRLYPLQEVLKQTDEVSDLTGEKTCVGIMLFWNYRPRGNEYQYSNTIENVVSILDMLDPKRYRLSFCEYNPFHDIGEAETYPEYEAKKLLELAQTRHFEAKLFSSFGRDKQSACGMLGGKVPESFASEKWRELDNMAEIIIEELQ